MARTRGGEADSWRKGRQCSRLKVEARNLTTDFLPLYAMFEAYYFLVLWRSKSIGEVSIIGRSTLTCDIERELLLLSAVRQSGSAAGDKTKPATPATVVPCLTMVIGRQSSSHPVMESWL